MKRRLGGDEGATLIVVTLVMLLLVALGAIVLTRSDHAETASTRDRNNEIALGVAEAGIDETISWIESREIARNPISGCTTTVPPGAQPAQGTMRVLRVCKQFSAGSGSPSYVIDTEGSVGARLEGVRRIRVTLQAPAALNYALFSTTSIALKNNDRVVGDVWANKSITLENGSSVKGNVTSAEGWIDLGQGDPRFNYTVQGNVWSGDHHPSNWAVRLANGGRVDGNVKASVKDPTDPTLCSDETHNKYDVPVPGQARIEGRLTTWGSRVGLGHVGSFSQECTQADPAKPMPGFNFAAANHDNCADNCNPITRARFLQLVAENGNRLGCPPSAAPPCRYGTFFVQDPAPTTRIAFPQPGVEVVGDTWVISNTPIVTSNVTDSPDRKLLVLVSTYAPSGGEPCESGKANSDCAIYLDNNFRLNGAGTACITAFVAYAPNGPIAMKNNPNNDSSPEICGGLYGSPVLLNNGQDITWDPRIQRLIGFGGVLYEVVRWEELPS